MDPLSAIGLVSNIISFIEAGYEVVLTSRQIYQSGSGAAAENSEIQLLTDSLQGLSLALRPEKPVAAMTAEEFRLRDLAQGCQEVSAELLLLLERLKAKKPNSKRHAVGAAVRSMLKQRQINSLEAKLDKYRQQLHLQLSQTSRLETIEWLGRIQKSGECQQNELQSLQFHVKALSHNIKASNIGASLLQDVQLLLDRSDSALNAIIQNTILSALRFEKMKDRDEEITEAYFSTYNWLLDDAMQFEYSPGSGTGSDTGSGTGSGIGSDSAHSNEAPHWDPVDFTNEPLRYEARKSFVSWLSEGSGIFHISGKPGAGKSTLMKYIFEHPRTREHLEAWADGKQLTVANFFFWRHGTDFQKSFKGLLRSLLYSILEQHPQFIKTIFPRQWEIAGQGLPLQFENQKVKDALQALILGKGVCENHRFAFFIDGLDEFQGIESELVQSLFNWVNSSSGAVKICVSSRELPIFQERFSACPKLRLHELTQSDIEFYVQDTLRNNEDVKAMDGAAKDFAELGAAIVEKAEGVFLWVTLAVRTVEQGIVAGDRLQDLAKKIDFLPNEVEDLFQTIFEYIKKAHPMDRRRAMIILSSVLDSTTPGFWHDTRLLDLSFLDDFEQNREFSDTMTWPLSSQEIENQLKRGRKRVDFSCRGFATVAARSAEGIFTRKIFPHAEDTVVLAHRSLVEFFRKPEIESTVREEVQNFNFFQFFCQTYVAGLKISAAELRTGTKEFQKTLFYDLQDVICGYFLSENPSLPHLLSALRGLEDFMRKEVESDMLYTTPLTIPCEWTNGENSFHDNRKLEHHPSVIPIIRAAYFGIHEIWSFPGNRCNDDLGVDIHDMLHEFLYRCLVPTSRREEPLPPAERFLQGFAFYLSNGVSPEENAYFRFKEYETASGERCSPTLWHLVLWNSVISKAFNVSPDLLFILFLFFGADPNFWLTFDTSHGVKRFEGTVSVMGLYGQEKRVVFSPIFIPNDPSPILNLAQRNNWSISLGDLVGFWFPESSDRIQKLIALNASRGGRPGPDELAKLATEYGVDFESWALPQSGTPRPLFGTWAGTTKRLKKSLVTSDGKLRMPLSEVPLSAFASSNKSVGFQ